MGGSGKCPLLHFSKLGTHARLYRRAAIDAARPETRVLALTVVDRESMLRALDEPPTDALAELRGMLLSEHEWRVREGLV